VDPLGRLAYSAASCAFVPVPSTHWVDKRNSLLVMRQVDPLGRRYRYTEQTFMDHTRASRNRNK